MYMGWDKASQLQSRRQLTLVYQLRGYSLPGLPGIKPPPRFASKTKKQMNISFINGCYVVGGMATCPSPT